MSSIPLIVCGKNPKIAANVRQGLTPEYDVIHIILTMEQALSELPVLLSGQKVNNTSDNIGSQNYAQRPEIVAVGGGFNDEMVEQMTTACKGAGQALWVRADTSKMSEMPSIDDPEAFGAATAKRVKAKLIELKEDGMKEGVHFY